MLCQNCYGLNALYTIAMIMMNLLIVWYTVQSANHKVDEKHLVMDKAKSIVRQLDSIDDIVFCHNPVYHFIKIKSLLLQINAAVDAMDNDDDDLASEYFTDALLLIGPNQKVSRLMHNNLPRHIITKIKRNYGKYLEEVDDVKT
ncbi:PREDICTED: uncharacterized protein LOC107173433 [Diuraphis noxia]|uniref:uncharacterized protein LOC107173433 n=1 Tax=Diuraphis noxia TaxID=143948 RepID=UPI0007636207|nr:PREDICTED: uncharacterized protein LOC107173433 [Diuraphis noxia]